MISTLCFDNIILMSCFLELWYDIIENIWNPCFDFLRHNEINVHKVSGTASQRQGAVRVFASMSDWAAAMFAPALALLCGQQASSCQFLTVPCWSNLSTLYFIGGRSSILPTDWRVLILCIIFHLENLYLRVKWYVEHGNVLLNLISQWNLCQYITFYRNHNFV